jgi:hypothetical protein
MDKITFPSENTSASSRLDGVIEREQNVKKKVARSIAGYGGVMVSIFLMFITVMVITTDITISLESIAHLSTEFFLLLFCSYASYICCSDSGAKAGTLSKIYIDAVNKFNELQHVIIDKKIHLILGDFCKDYIATELKNAKTYYLVSAGIDYDEYIGKYSSLEDAEILELSGLSTAQKKALMSANAVKPIKLYPEQIIRAGGGNSRRSPLLISPEVRKRANYIFKFFSIVSITLGMSLIALNDVTSSSWTIFVMIIVKLGSVLYNCFSGYKTGYENIVIHKVNYMNEQISLMQQAIVFDAERKDKNVENKYICTHEVRIGSGNSES